METNKRSHTDHTSSTPFRNRQNSQNKAQNHSCGETPQQSQLETDFNISNSSSDQETNKDRAPSLTDGSTGSSSGLEKSESPEEDEDSGNDRRESFDMPLPMLASALFQINLRYPEYPSTDLPILPSLGKDSIVQNAFSHAKTNEFQPHDGRHHGLSSSVYKEDQAWRSNPAGIHRLQKQVNDEFESNAPRVPNAPPQPQPCARVIANRNQYDAPSNVEVSSSDRPYRCTLENCNWSFLRSSDQKRHIRSHNKPLLQCPYWGFNQSCHRNSGAFNRLDVLKRHLRLMHYEQEANSSRGKCKHCLKSFTTLKPFFDHCNSCSKDLIDHPTKDLSS